MRFDVLARPGGSDGDASWTPGTERQISDPGGQFALGLDRAGKTWVGVRAEGQPLWDVWTEVPPGGKTLDVRLGLGVTLTARVETPDGGTAGVTARLAPRHDAGDWAVSTTAVAPDGSFRFEHLRPGGITVSGGK